MNELAAPSPLRTGAWVLYDLANTVYSATITFLFFTYLSTATALGVTTTLSMILAGACTPLFSCVSDRTGRAGRYCALATLGCIGAMSLFGVFPRASVPLLMAAYFLSNVFYQAALVFYNSLLPSVATREHMGRVSGLGVGLGYLGTIFTVLIAVPVQVRYGARPAFILTALVFLLCALPCMLLVHDRRPIARERVSWPLVREQWRALLESIKRLPGHPALMWFLCSNFFAVDVLNTAIFFYGRFVEQSFAPLADEGRLALLGRPIATLSGFKSIAGLAVTVPALGFALLVGSLADRLGAEKAFGLSLLCLAGGLSGAGVFSGWSPLLFLLSMSCLGGLGLAGIWTAGRKLLIQLVPQKHVGRYFGLYGITNKVSVVGSTVFGVLLDHGGPRVAVLSQVLALAVAFYCLSRAVRRRSPNGGDTNDGNLTARAALFRR